MFSFIINGQSNAEGRRGLGSSGVPIGYINVPRIKTFQTDQVLRKGADPVDANVGGFGGILDNSGVGFGWGMPFADTLLNSHAIRAMLVPVARGGTRIAQWTNRNASDPADTTTYYGCGIVQALAAHAIAPLKAMIWHQGESDAADGTTQATYETALGNYISNMRSDLSMPDLPFIIVKLHQWVSAIETNNNATQAEWNAIQAAQEAVAGSVSNCYLVDASDLTGESGDEIHLSVASYKTLGERIAAGVSSNVF